MFKQPTSFADVKDVRVQEHKGRRHVRLEQTFNGIPIHGAEYLVHILPDDRIYMVNGTFYRDVQANLNRKISETEAVESVKKDLGSPLDQATVETELVIYPDNESFRLVWKVNAVSHTGRFSWTYFINALDGAIIKKQDNIDYDNGTGKVYLKHPFLTPNTTTVTLENLDGSGYLRGTYADVFTSEEYWFQLQES